LIDLIQMGTGIRVKTCYMGKER